VAVNVQALQAGSLQGGEYLGFRKMPLAVDGCLLLASAPSVIAVALYLKARLAYRSSSYVRRSQATPDESLTALSDHCGLC
jgi:hypothetical protein